MDFPQDLKFTQNDEWIRVEGTTGTLGISDYAQDQLSDIVYVDFVADEGDSLSKGAIFCAVESVKAAADVYVPVDCTVTAANESLMDAPELVNSDPYGEAWMIKIEITDPSGLEGLMDADAYAAYVKGRE